MSRNGPPPIPTGPSPNTEIGGSRRREPGSWRLVLAEIAQIVARVWRRLIGKEIGPGSDKAQAVESLATIFEATTEQAGRYLESKGGDWREVYAEILFDDERERAFRLWWNGGGRIFEKRVRFGVGFVNVLPRIPTPPKRPYYG